LPRGARLVEKGAARLYIQLSAFASAIPYRAPDSFHTGCMADDQTGDLPIASVRLRRLAGSLPSESIPTFDDLGLVPLVAEASLWQHLRAGGWFWEVIAAAGGTADQHDRWREIALLMGSAAESVLLSAGCEVEIEILRRALAAESLPNQYVLAQRFFAESEGTQVLAFGHRLANLFLRALMLDSSYPFGAVCPKRFGIRFPVLSDERACWIALSELPSLELVVEAAPHESLRRLFAPVLELLQRAEWRQLDERRAADFHRWRDETPLVAGAERSPLWRHDPIKRTRTLEIVAIKTPEPAAAASVVNDIISISRSALDLMEPTMRRFRETWMEVMSDLSGGKFSWVEEGGTVRPTITP
jgi:hypothetical protein